jgi:hypothetical protein
MVRGREAADQGLAQMTGASCNEDSHVENFLTRTFDEKEKTKALERAPGTNHPTRHHIDGSTFTRPALRTATSWLLIIFLRD